VAGVTGLAGLAALARRRQRVLIRITPAVDAQAPARGRGPGRRRRLLVRRETDSDLLVRDVGR
jgi:hypothetical protein